MLKVAICRKFSLGCTQFRFQTLRNVVFSNELQLLTSRLSNVCLSEVPYSSAADKNDIEFQPVRIEELKKKYVKPVDWLPFEWHRRERHNPFVKSGDLVKELEYDPSWPKPDFELSDELKTANEEVKGAFSLSTGSKKEIKEVVKRNILKKVQRHPNDFESLEVNIAIRTINIRSVFEHMRQYKRERRGGRHTLYMMINKRNQFLKNLYRMDRERFNWLIQELKLEYTPKPLGSHPGRYCKKWDLRRLTPAYCKMIEKNKKLAYHEELKQQQADFLKEKEEILAWIEKEEEELAKMNV